MDRRRAKVGAVSSAAMAGILRALANIAPYALGAIGLAVLLFATTRFIGSPGFSYDFAAYDLAARRIAEGGPLYPAGVAEAYNSGAYANLYLYAPPLAVALLPAALLPPETAALAWFWLRVGLLVAGCAILPMRPNARIATLGVAGLSFPVLLDLNIGNLSIVLFALSAVIWRFRDRPAAAAALAAILTVRYWFAIVLVSWLLRRAFRPIAWAIVAGLAIAAITLPIVGLGGWVDYVTILTGLRDVSTGPHNLTLADTAAALGLPAALKPFLVLASIVAALIVTAYSALRRDAETALIVALTASLLFAPFLHPHYLVQLLIPAAFLAGRGHWWGLGLPLLGWLPGPVMPVVAIAGMLAPLAAGRPLETERASSPLFPPRPDRSVDGAAGS
jgi:hypothetical protein